ncbi:MAG: LutC/YkgG family protein [Adhaeribacter sp.]
MYEPRSKDIILGKIREALAKPAPFMPSTPDFATSVHPLPDEDLSITFATVFLRNSGTFIYCDSDENFFDHLYVFKKEKKIEHLYVWEPELKAHLQAGGIDFNDDEASFIKNAEASLTTCEALIARTGSILVSGANESGRRLSIYPEKHLVLAFASQLLPDIKDGLAYVRQKYNKIPSMLSLVSGPSRTADIEKTLVMGAHGPKELVLFLIDDTLH